MRSTRVDSTSGEKQIGPQSGASCHASDRRLSIPCYRRQGVAYNVASFADCLVGSRVSSVIGQEFMAFHTADYDTYVLLGDPAAQPLWHWNAWRKPMPEIDSLVRRARGTAGVRSTQVLPNRGGAVRFGRIGWNERDQQKWTHGSPANSAASATWKFLSAEL
jgi:hypothetical protein